LTISRQTSALRSTQQRGAWALTAVLAAALLGMSCVQEPGQEKSAPDEFVPSELCCDPAAKPGAGMNPVCTEGTTCCADGTWQCNWVSGEPMCDESGGLCEIAACDPAAEPGVGGNPPCFEGATCCPDGQWRCNDFGGPPACG
jgi:hypothetical protein